MKAALFFLGSSYSAAACLYAVGSLGTDAEAAVPADHLSPGSEAEANNFASVDDDGSPTAVPTEESELAKSPISDHPRHVSDLGDGSAPSASGETLLVLPEAYAVETRLQTDLSIPSLSSQSEKHRLPRPRLSPSLRCACVLLAVYLGVMALRTKEVPPDSQPARSLHVGEQQQHHGSETVTTGQPLPSVDELKKVQPLAARLTEMVETEESRSALRDLRSSQRRSQDIDETAVGRVTGPSGSPPTAVKTAIEDSVPALSVLYEAAREHGQALAEAARKAVSPEFSDEEMEALKSALGTNFGELLDLREQSILFSSHVCIDKVEKAAAELKGLRRLETTEDLHLLDAAAKSLEMLKAAHAAIKMESQLSHEIISKLAAELFWHYQVHRRSIHRELETELRELRILCTLERQRRQHLPIQDVSALETLELVEQQLKIGEQQLEKHEKLMEQVQNAGDIVSALEAENQAIAVADSLKALLAAAASSRRSIPGVASEEEAAQSEAVQRYRKQLANTRMLQAEKDWKRAADMLKAAEMEVSSDFASPSEHEDTASERPPFARRMNTMLARIVADMLKEVEDANAALHKPANAEEDTEEESSSAAARLEELLGASQAAAKAAMHSLKLAGFIWLNALLKKPLEVDMRLSTTRVREATATVRRAIGEEAQQQHEHIEMSAADIQEFEELLAQFNSGQEKAQSANGLNELASAVAGMKQAALKLMMFVEERQKQQTKR